MTVHVEVTSHTKFGHQELVTFRLRYPRKIHAQFLTHRQFSRNSMSSRAMRIDDMVSDVLDDPAVIEMRLHGKGMQPSEEAPSGEAATLVIQEWRDLRDHTITFARRLDALGWAKEEVNRFLEPFAHIWTVVTMTPEALLHFCSLRNIKAGAQAAIDVLASEMLRAYRQSVPVKDQTPLHIPFRRATSELQLPEHIEEQVAFAARVSFAKDARDFTPEANLKLARRLWLAEPKHASPMEHICLMGETVLHQRCNFGDYGWLQLRHVPDVLGPAVSLNDAATWLLRRSGGGRWC